MDIKTMLIRDVPQLQAALEAEITEFLGRDRYQRAAGGEDVRPGSRDGKVIMAGLASGAGGVIAVRIDATYG
jgi:transposase-like protein